jgi:hypothetical protein
MELVRTEKRGTLDRKPNQNYKTPKKKNKGVGQEKAWLYWTIAAFFLRSFFSLSVCLLCSSNAREISEVKKVWMITIKATAIGFCHSKLHSTLVLKPSKTSSTIEGKRRVILGTPDRWRTQHD